MIINKECIYTIESMVYNTVDIKNTKLEEEAAVKTIDIHVKNNIYQHIEVLKNNRNKRYKHKEFFVEGVRNINAAIEKGWRIKSFIYGERGLSDWAKDILKNTRTEENYRLFNNLAGELSSKTDTSELMAIIEMREDKEILENLKVTDSTFMVLFDRPSNKGNLGTLIRSCDAFGVDMLILTGHSVDLYDPDVISSSMGSFFNLQVVRISEYDTLNHLLEAAKRQQPGFKLIGTTAHQAEAIDHADLSLPLMFMVGNETMGLNKTYKALCDRLCTIPMDENANASSFNVSCAASIIMYEITRQRRSYEVRDTFTGEILS